MILVCCCSTVHCCWFVSSAHCVLFSARCVH